MVSFEPMSDVTTSEVVGFLTLAFLLLLLLVLFLREEAVRLLDWGRMIAPHTTDVLLISLLGTFCGAAAWMVGHELFAAVFLAAAVVAGSQVYQRWLN